MNPFALWIPGTLLFLAGFVLLVLGHVGFGVGIAIVLFGIALESAGILLWLRERQASKKR